MAVIKQKEQRVAMLIDTQNLYHTARNLYGAKVNFGAVLKEAVAGRHLIRAVAYVITTEKEDEKSFFEALNTLGIETKTKDLQVFFGGAKKGDWDVGLAVDAIRIASKVDAVILASGDGDFVPLVEYLKFMGTQVEIITFGRSASSKLREAADDFIDMCDDQRKYLMGFRGGNRRSSNNGRRHPNKPAVNEAPKTE
ncbi:MAG: NYN domain-containing protein [Candidatus Pacebacteria bacterium]|nr:NYN domain-containing protein [Candidatus Paceibacterota bacterium]